MLHSKNASRKHRRAAQEKMNARSFLRRRRGAKPTRIQGKGQPFIITESDRTSPKQQPEKRKIAAMRARLGLPPAEVTNEQ